MPEEPKGDPWPLHTHAHVSMHLQDHVHTKESPTDMIIINNNIATSRLSAL